MEDHLDRAPVPGEAQGAGAPEEEVPGVLAPEAPEAVALGAEPGGGDDRDVQDDPAYPFPVCPSRAYSSLSLPCSVMDEIRL